MEWSSDVMAVDASNCGLGATVAKFSHDEVSSLGRFSERWRFESDNFMKLRVEMGDQSDEADASQWAVGFPGVHKELRPFSIGEERDESYVFSPVPEEMLNHWSSQRKRQQPMPILEGRARLFAVKHFLRKVSNHHRKHLIFSDSMSAICAIVIGDVERRTPKSHTTNRSFAFGHW